MTPDQALLAVEPGHLDQLLHDQIDPAASVEVLGKGLPASPGAAQGEIVFSAEDAVAAVKAGREGACWCAARPAPRTSRA